MAGRGAVRRDSAVAIGVDRFILVRWLRYVREISDTLDPGRPREHKLEQARPQ